MKIILRSLGVVLSLAWFANGFVVMPVTHVSCGVKTGAGGMCMSVQSSDRRTFLAREMAGALGVGLGISAVSANPRNSFADLADLSSTDAPAEKTVRADSEEARVKRKLEAQAKATGKASSGRMTYQESMVAEMEKQKELKKDNARRRQSMCEELGRGC